MGALIARNKRRLVLRSRGDVADGGRCVSDLVALGLQPALFGDVASISTARRVLLSVGEAELGRLRSARPQARGRARGRDPRLEATPITAHSEKEFAAGSLQGRIRVSPAGGHL
jgi:hypothetical protein